MREDESIAIAEQAVIASVLLDDTSFSQCVNTISADDFASKPLATVFKAFKELWRAGVAINLVSTCEYLGRIGALDKLGGPGYLASLCDNIGSSSQAGYYAQKVLEASVARQYARTCRNIHIEAKQAAEGKQKLADIIAKHLTELDKISHFATDSCNRIDWKNARPDNVYPMVWPLGIHEWVNLFPKNIAVIGGASNAGKTAFMLNVAYHNRLRHPVKYFSSEMGPEELRLRLQLFRRPLTEWECVEFFDRSSNFAPMIDPDALNIIDYLEITDNFYQIGGEIKAIFDRLKTGIAVIGIQKKKDVDYARGGEFTLEKARLYIALDYGTAKIIKGKNWAQPGVRPDGLVFNYELKHGCKFDRGEE